MVLCHRTFRAELSGALCGLRVPRGTCGSVRLTTLRWTIRLNGYCTGGKRRRPAGHRSMIPEGDVSNRPTSGSEGRLSRAGVGRLSLYLRRLEGLLREGT